MYKPKYTITHQILKNIAQIEACREVIDNAPLIPAWEAEFKEDAVVRSVHYGTHLEGNELDLAQIKRIVNGQEVAGRDRDIQEVLNYREVMKFIDQSGKEKNNSYTKTLLKKIHKQTINRLVDSDQAGVFRQSKVVIRDMATGEIIFTPPSAVEVPYLVESFLSWLNEDNDEKESPVLRAGVTHYVLAAIHPFTEGNGRVARAITLLVLFREGYDFKRLFSPEEYYDRHAAEYYQALKRVSDQGGEIADRDLTYWLEFFCEGLAIELGKIKEKVRRLSIDSKIKQKAGKQIVLTQRQIKLMEYIEANGEIRMEPARRLLPKVSDDTVLRELQDLIKKGLLKKVGHTKGAKYIMEI